MKCSILGLCLFLSLFFWPVPFIMWPFDLGVLLFKTLIRVHNPFCALHLISHYMLSWRCVKASSGNKTARVIFICAYMHVSLCVHAWFHSPYLCDPWSVLHCGFGLWMVLAKSSHLCYEFNMNHMLIQKHTQSAIFKVNLKWWDNGIKKKSKRSCSALEWFFRSTQKSKKKWGKTSNNCQHISQHHDDSR